MSRVRDLLDRSLGYLVTLAGAIPVIAVACIGYLSGRWEQTEAQPALSKYERQLIDLDRQAISSAYRDQVHDLFRGWAKDGYEQPKRASTGARQARRMFDEAMAAVDERERRLKEAGGQ